MDFNFFFYLLFLNFIKQEHNLIYYNLVGRWAALKIFFFIMIIIISIIISMFVMHFYVEHIKLIYL
jgi:hypothetical protein